VGVSHYAKRRNWTRTVKRREGIPDNYDVPSPLLWNFCGEECFPALTQLSLFGYESQPAKVYISSAYDNDKFFAGSNELSVNEVLF